MESLFSDELRRLLAYPADPVPTSADVAALHDHRRDALAIVAAALLDDGAALRFILEQNGAHVGCLIGHLGIVAAEFLTFLGDAVGAEPLALIQRVAAEAGI